MLQAFALGDLAPAQPETIAELNTLWREITAPPADTAAQKLDTLFADMYERIVDTSVQKSPAIESALDVPQPVLQLDALFEAAYARIVGSDVLFDSGFD